MGAVVLGTSGADSRSISSLLVEITVENCLNLSSLFCHLSFLASGKDVAH